MTTVDQPGMYEVKPIGWVRSGLVDRSDAPKQADEGAPPARIELVPGLAAAVQGLQPGDEVMLLTWLHLADRGTLAVHPRGDLSRPETGVFATRSPDRPNPVGVHIVTITSVSEHELRVAALEAIDGTPVIDIKPPLGCEISRR
jgi:tRNA-Thr(GGU) m(6)t(6)A37 methyltransferase TsaA